MRKNTLWHTYGFHGKLSICGGLDVTVQLKKSKEEIIKNKTKTQEMLDTVSK